MNKQNDVDDNHDTDDTHKNISFNGIHTCLHTRTHSTNQ